MDINNDGILDILSGCYQARDKDKAQIFVLYGKGSLDFSPATPLLNKAGAPVKAFSGYSASKQPTPVYCTHPYACDWDKDGDLDIIMGESKGNFYLIKQSPDHLGKLGFNEHAEIIKDTEGKPLYAPGGKSSPCVIDWDSDGDLDILTGSHNGGAYLFTKYANQADKNSSAAFGKPSTLVAATRAELEQEIDGFTPARYSRLAVYDWNNDGKLDIILGDHLSISSPLSTITSDQYKSMRATQMRTTALVNQLRASLRKLGANTPADTRQSLAALSQQCYEMKKHYRSVRRSGHIWLFLSK